MSDRELKRWASDQLHELLGFSQGYLADYVLSLARKERTVAGLVKALGEAESFGVRTPECKERVAQARAVLRLRQALFAAVCSDKDSASAEWHHVEKCLIEAIKQDLDQGEVALVQDELAGSHYVKLYLIMYHEAIVLGLLEKAFFTSTAMRRLENVS